MHFIFFITLRAILKMKAFFWHLACLGFVLQHQFCKLKMLPTKLMGLKKD